MRQFLSCWLLLAGLFGLPGTTAAADKPERLEFTRMIAHWDAYDSPEYLDFVRDAQPEVVQVGFYGAHFWSLGHTPQFGGYPAHFPIQGLRELGDWFERLNGQLHERGAKVVGHFNVEFLVGDPDGPEGPTGFFKFYRDLWDEAELGPRPVADPVDLLEKKDDGTPIRDRTYAIGGMNEHWACLRNPAWRTVLKAWVRQGIKRGLDGFMVNYFYRHNCLCKYCQADFRAYLGQRFSPAELKDRFEIGDLKSHVFSEIVSWHPASETSPLRLEMLRFSQISNKRAFDEVFLEYGRSLKPDLIVGQWNHLGNFSQVDGDERCLLPENLWGRGESYLWYSTGGSANATDLRNHILGEGTLQARYIRGTFDDKPFTLGKYEATRVRTAIAELAANGGAPMGFYTRFSDAAARAEIVRYYQFMRKYESLYKGNRPIAEATLLFPRTKVHAGEVSSVAAFRSLGQALLDEHLLFEVRPDDVKPEGSTVIQVSETLDAVLARLDRRSQFKAPSTVRVSASRPASGAREIDIHLVNYDREEPLPAPDGTPSPSSGIHEERPRSVRGIAADVVLPAGMRVAKITFLTPEQTQERTLQASEQQAGHVRFEVPEFLVYSVVRIELSPDR